MRQYKNGDKCPCCGSVLRGKTDAWLQEFSALVDMLRLPPWEDPPPPQPVQPQELMDRPYYRNPEVPNPKLLTPSPFLSAAKPPAEEMERIIQAALDKAFERVEEDPPPPQPVQPQELMDRASEIWRRTLGGGAAHA